METAENKRVVYEFGKFLLDPGEKTIFSDGVAIRLPAKGFETLLMLVENNGHALSKEEMISAIWHDSFVEESNLAKQISRLRKIFNTNGENLIETLPKHGYRFSADVRRTVEVAAEPIVFEKRTLKRMTVRVENDLEEVDRPPELPAVRSGLLRRSILAFLALIVLGGAFLAWIWKGPSQISQPPTNAIAFLTDASRDDSGPHWIGEGQINFTRKISSTRSETWRMNPDGTDQQRANAEIRDLQYGRWSPDGKKVVFLKDSDSKTFYLADASGKNQIVLPFIVGNMDWSPDGLQFVYQSVRNEKGNFQIYLYTLATGENVSLTKSEFASADPSFSYDGKQIAFVSWRDGDGGEIYVMDKDGSNERRITNHPAFDNYPVFTPDGTAIAFQSNRENERTEIYLQNLNNNMPPVKIAATNGETGISPKCWSADGTQILFYTDQGEKAQIGLLNVEPFPARIVLSDGESDLNSPRLAPDGKRILYEARLADLSIEIRLADLESKKATVLLKTAGERPPRFSLSPSWSPDASLITFTDKAGNNSEVFIMNADGTGLKNVTNDPQQDTNPVFTPDGSEIVFVRSSYGTAQLYRMNLQGGDQRHLTERRGYEASPAFSHDGSVLVFSGDREGRGFEIFALDFSDPNDERLVAGRRFHDGQAAFSPDGRRIAFVATSDGNNEIYIVNSDGSGMFRLTRNKADDSTPAWSTDGNSIFFSSDRGGKSAIYQIDIPF